MCPDLCQDFLFVSRIFVRMLNDAPEHGFLGILGLRGFYLCGQPIAPESAQSINPEIPLSWRVCSSSTHSCDSCNSCSKNKTTFDFITNTNLSNLPNIEGNYPARLFLS